MSIQFYDFPLVGKIDVSMIEFKEHTMKLEFNINDNSQVDLKKDDYIMVRGMILKVKEIISDYHETVNKTKYVIYATKLYLKNNIIKISIGE